MSEEKQEAEVQHPKDGAEYDAPAIEEVVSRDRLEREAAYAGVPGGSGLPPN